VLDYGLTLQGINEYGVEIEGNPLVKRSIEKGQSYLVLVVKLAFSVLLVSLWYLSVTNERVADTHRKIVNYIYKTIYVFDVVVLFAVNVGWTVILLGN